MSNSDLYTTVMCNGDIYKIVTPNTDICTIVMSYSGYPHHYRFSADIRWLSFHTVNRYPQGMPAVQPVSIPFSYPHDSHLLQPITTSVKKMVKVTSTTATLALCAMTVIVQSALQRIVPVLGWFCVSWLLLYHLSYRDCTTSMLALCVMTVMVVCPTETVPLPCWLCVSWLSW